MLLRGRTICLLFIAFIAALHALPAAAQNAECTGDDYKWAYNSAGKSPCAVASTLNTACGSQQPFQVLPAGAAGYGGPGKQDDCLCNLVEYNLLRVCALCQERNGPVEEFKAWATHCTSTDAVQFTGKMPGGLVVPAWSSKGSVNGPFKVEALKDGSGGASSSSSSSSSSSTQPAPSSSSSSTSPPATSSSTNKPEVKSSSAAAVAPPPPAQSSSAAVAAVKPSASTSTTNPAPSSSSTKAQLAPSSSSVPPPSSSSDTRPSEITSKTENKQPAAPPSTASNTEPSKSVSSPPTTAPPPVSSSSSNTPSASSTTTPDKQPDNSGPSSSSRPSDRPQEPTRTTQEAVPPSSSSNTPSSSDTQPNEGSSASGNESTGTASESGVGSTTDSIAESTMKRPKPSKTATQSATGSSIDLPAADSQASDSGSATEASSSSSSDLSQAFGGIAGATPLYSEASTLMTAVDSTSAPDAGSKAGPTSSPHDHAHASDQAHSYSSSGISSSAASSSIDSAIGALGADSAYNDGQSYIEQQDDQAAKDKQKRTNTAIICSMLGVTLLGLAVATRFFFVKQKKKREDEEDPGNLGLNDTNQQEKAAGVQYSSESDDGHSQDSYEELVPAAASPPRQSLWANIRKSFKPVRPPRPSALPPLPPALPPPPPNLAALRQQTSNPSSLRSNNNSRPSSDYNYNDAIYYGQTQQQQNHQEMYHPYESPAPPQIFVSDADLHQQHQQQQEHAGFPFPNYVNSDSIAYGQTHYEHRHTQNPPQPYM